MNKRLTIEERISVACYHHNNSWVLDSNTGHMVDSHCGKPAPDAVLRICSECGDEFVMNFGPDWLPKFYVVQGKVYEREFFCPPCY